jgi:hypothetical protein
MPSRSEVAPPRGMPPNQRMQPTGRSVPDFVPAPLADGDQWRVELCGHGPDRPQLMRISLGGVSQMLTVANFLPPSSSLGGRQ